MKNLFKKLLASCLVVCMVLTLCVGAITVNAENPTGTVVAGTTTVDSGEGTAVVPVEVSAGVAASKVSVKVPANLTITALTLDTADEDVDVTYASAADPNGKPISLVEATEFVAPYVDAEGVFSYIIHAPAGEVTTAPVTVKISFTGTFVENAEGILVDVEAQAAPDAVVLFDLTVTDGKIIVKAAHVCEFVGTVTQAPTCTVPGVKTYACTCGEGTYTEEIPVIAHTEETIAAVDATCTTAGSTAGVKCSVCQTVITAPVATDALGHAWVDGDITYTDCTSDGNLAQTCSRCDATQTVAVAPKGHTPVAYEEVAATCTTVGYTGGTYCSAEGCGAVIEARTEIPATGHDDVYTNNGDNHTITCKNGCDKNVTEAHNYVDGTCVCGAKQGPVIDPEFDNPLRFIVGIEATVGVNVVFTKPAKYDSFKVKVNRNAFDSKYNYTPAAEIVWEADDAYLNAGNQYGFNYKDVPLYAMSEKIVFTFEGYEDGVLTGISNPYEWRLDKFVAEQINTNTKITDEERELYSEVLWLGEYAHINFKESAAATASIQYLDSPVALISTQPVEGYTIPDLTKEVTENGAVTFARTMVGVTTAPEFKVIMSGMTADIRANALFTAVHTSKLLGVQSFPYSLNLNDSIMQQAGAMNAYAHNNIALYDSDKLIEFKVEKDGVVLGKYTTSLAIETYKARNQALDQGKAQTAAMYERVLILGESARRCFEK